MKITIISDMYGTANNGTANAINRLIKAMRARGHEITLVSPYEGESSTGMKYISVPPRSVGGLKWYIAKNGVILGKPIKEKILQGIQDADVVHLMLPFKMSICAVKLLKKYKIPFTAACHFQPQNLTAHLGMENWDLLNNALYHRIQRKFFKNVRFVHCPSEFAKNYLINLGFKNEFRVISNGVTPNFKHVDTNKPENLKDKFCIINTGRYTREKRQDVLIKAVAKSKYADKIQLICAGQGPTEKHLRKLGNRLPNPIVMGYLDYKVFIDALNYSDLYVHPSEVEWEGISCLEAMSCGLPCIFSDHKNTASKTLALDDRSLFRAGDVKDLTAKIDYMIEHEEERRELAKRYEKHAQNFEFEKCMDQMEAMFSEATDYYNKLYAEEAAGATLNKFSVTKNPNHTVKVPYKKKRKAVDSNYKFESKNIFYSTYCGVVRGIALLFLPLFIRIKYGYKIKGKKNLKKIKNTGAVLVANHVHYMDGALICSRVFRWRKVRFITLSDSLGIPFAGHFMKVLGAHPTADDIGGARNSKRVLDSLLRNKKLVLIFPEGSLHPYSTEIREFYPGAFKLAESNNVPVLPLVYTFKQRKKPNGEIKNKLILNIGSPIYPTAGLTSRERSEDLGQRTRHYFNTVCEDYYMSNPVLSPIKYIPTQTRTDDSNEDDDNQERENKKIKINMG